MTLESASSREFAIGHLVVIRISSSEALHLGGDTAEHRPAPAVARRKLTSASIIDRPHEGADAEVDDQVPEAVLGEQFGDPPGVEWISL